MTKPEKKVCVFYPANVSYVIEKMMMWEEMKKNFLHLFYFYKSLQLYTYVCEGVSRREDSFDLLFLDNPVIIGQTEVFSIPW